MTTIADGIYVISSRGDPRNVLTMDICSTKNPAFTSLSKLNGSKNQHWNIENIKDGGCTIRNVLTRRFLSTSGDVEAGVALYGTTSPMRWNLASDDVYYLLSVNGTRLYLDIKNWGDSRLGIGLARLKSVDCEARIGQSWMFARVEEHALSTRASRIARRTTLKYNADDCTSPSVPPLLVPATSRDVRDGESGLVTVECSSVEVVERIAVRG